MSEDGRRGRVGRRAAARRARSRVPAGRARDRGRLRARPRLALGLESTSSSATSTPRRPRRSPAAEAAGARVERHPADKDATDLELALDAALRIEPARGSSSSAATAAGSTTCSRRPAARRRRYARVAVDARRRRGARARRARRARRSTARRASSSRSLAVAGPADGVTHRGPRVPAARRDARARLDPRRQQRVRGDDGARVASSAASCSRSAREAPMRRHDARRCLALVARRDRSPSPAAAAATSSRPRSCSSPTTRSRSRRRCCRRSRTRPASRCGSSKAGDAGEVVNRRSSPRATREGDVFFGVDNTLLARALDGDLFEPYESPGSRASTARYALDPEHRVTPIDYGDVCLNYDKALVRGAAASRRRERSTTSRAALPRPARGREPGHLVARARVPARDDRAVRRGRLAGLLAQAARERRARRRRLGGGVLRAFSGAAGSKGDRPDRRLVRVEPAGRGLLRGAATDAGADRRRRVDSCFRQVEFAGVLRGARNEDGARKLVDFLLSKRFQDDMPLQMFVFPVVDATRRCRRCSSSSRSCPSARSSSRPTRSTQNRETWIDEWTDDRAALSARAWRAVASACRSRSSRSSSLCPVAAILERGLRGAGDPPLDVLTDPLRARSCGSPLWQALASTVLTLVVALPAAYVLARYDSAARARRARSWSCRSCCRRSWSRSRSSRSSPTASSAGVGRSWSRTCSSTSRSSCGSSAFWANLDPARRGRGDARRGAVARVPRGHRSRCSPRRSPRRARSCSSSRSRRSGSCSSSAGRGATLEAEIYRQAAASSTCGPRPCSRSCSSRRRRGVLGRDAIWSARLVVARTAAAGARRRAPAADGARQARRRGEPRRARALPRAAARGARRALARSRSGYGLDAYRALGRADQRAPRPAVGGDRELARLRRRRDA